MSTYTPGPWWVDARNFAGVETFVIRSGEKGREIASGHCIQPRRKADARLIAAAPELLEALLTARAHLRQLGDHGVDDVLDAAIAKAGGN